MIARLWRRYRVVIIFPTLSVGSIVADYSYTARWKQQRSVSKAE